MAEVDDVSDEYLEAAAEMYDDLIAGVFYQKQIESGYKIKFIKKEDDDEKNNH